jgi:hypothetical protein
MPKLETYRVNDFPTKAALEANDSKTDVMYMFDEHTHQGAFEVLSVETYDAAAKRSIRIGGTALLAAARFHGYINASKREGEIIVRHQSLNRRDDAFVTNS